MRTALKILLAVLSIVLGGCTLIGAFTMYTMLWALHSDMISFDNSVRFMFMLFAIGSTLRLGLLLVEKKFNKS